MTLDTTWSPAEAERRLASTVEGGGLAGDWKLSRHEHGHVRMTRHTTRGGRQSTIVIVSAFVRAGSNGSRVNVTVRAPASAIVFFVYFAASSIIGWGAATSAAIAYGGMVSIAVCALFAGVVPIFAWWIIVRQLLPEVRAAEAELRAMFPPSQPSADPFR